MDEGLKRRLIGAAVLASLAVIFVPMLFEEPPAQPPSLPPLPKPPPVQDFASEMLRDEVPAVAPLSPPPEPVVETQEPVVLETPALETPEAEPAEVAQPRTGLTAWVVQAAPTSWSRACAMPDCRHRIPIWSISRGAASTVCGSVRSSSAARPRRCSTG